MKAARTPTMAGLVLAGGHSRRFGRDKAAAIFAGQPLLAWSLDCLDQVCATVAVSARPRGRAAALAAALGRAVLSDDPAHAEGPLAGITAGLAWADGQGQALLATLPCDSPLISPGVFDHLAESLEAAGAAFAVTAEGPQPLCAIWRVAAFQDLAARLAAGDHPAVRAALNSAGAVAVRFDDPTPFRNINTPADAALAEAWLQESRRRI